MIFKLQREIYPSNGTVLIYDKKRTYVSTVPCTSQLTELFGDELKIFVRGSVDEDGKLRVVDVVEYQEW